MQHTRPNVSKSGKTKDTSRQKDTFYSSGLPSGLTISERRKSSSKMLSCQKSMPIVVRKIDSPKTPNRLVGGADVSEESAVEETPAKASPESVQEVPNPPPSPPTPSTPPSSPVEKSLEELTQPEENSQDKQLPPASGPCCFCIPQTPGSVGDRKVDEIIEYVHQNLVEAGKALATLGENFEHDLKLMFVDILGRIKQWTGIVQNKLDGCKNEVDNLRKELLARACEIDVKTRELKELRAQIADYQNGLPPNSESPKKGPKRSRAEQNEEREPSIRERQDQPVAENARRMNAKDTARAADPQDEEDVQAEITKEINRVGKMNARKNAARAADQEDEESEQAARVANGTEEGDEEDEEGARVVDRTDERDKEDEERVQAINRTNERIEEDEEEWPRRRGNGRKMKDVVSATVQTVVQERERMKRESELESEVARLRKKYERVIKERAEYESAIQRALLRGVSSLNVEALRVLRCPPIPCCTPCAPCPATAGIIPPEPAVPCPGKSTRRRPGSAAATVSSTKVSHDRSARNGEQADCTTKRPPASPCCSARRSRRPVDGGMVFLLHQGDAGNLGAPDEVCGPIMRRLEIPPLPRFGL